MSWEDYVPDFLPAVQSASFVQIGANCGMNTRHCAISGDPVWDYATRCHWRGVAVEAYKPIFRELCDNYLPHPTVWPMHTAVSDARRRAAVFRTGNREANHLLTEHEARRVMSGQRLFGGNVTVDVVRLHDVWAAVLALGVREVDVLVIDVEGEESKLLSSPLPSPPPRMVLYEHLHVAPSDQRRIHKALLSQGYALLADVGLWRGQPANRLYGRRRSRRK